MFKLKTPAKEENIQEIMAFAEETFKKFKFKGEKLEDSIESTRIEVEHLVKHAFEDSQITVRIKKEFSNGIVNLSCNGDELEEKESYAWNASYNRRGKTNYVKIFIGHKEKMFALKTLVSFGMAIVCCLLAGSVLPQSVIDWCISYIFSPIQTLFLNALRLVTAPAVFFSIMTAIVKFASIGNLERISKKSIIGYVVSAVVAIIVGIGIFSVSDPTSDITGALGHMVDSSVGKGHSILDTLTNSIPDNVIVPFLNVDALQLLMVAVICGIALAKVGGQVPLLNNAATALHKFFKTTVDIVTSIIPFAVFFVTTLMISMFGFESLLVTLRIFLMVIAGFVILMLLYVLYVGIVGRLNPIIFLRKMWPNMLEAFWNGSSVSQVPKTMEVCQNSFGVSPKVYNFTIPFGAIADLDGNCIYLTIGGLFLSGVCGVGVLGTDFVTVAFMVMVLSIGSAITPGSAMLALIMVMSQMGVSLTIICLILGINPLLELGLAMTNNMREVATTLVIAKQENLLDLDVYKKLEKVGK